MNKELLAKLYAKYNLQSVGSIDEFISDMQNPSVQEKFFNKYGLNKTGTIDEFRKDLGYTNPTAEKYNFEYNPDDPKSMVKSAFLNTISSLEGASPDTIVGGTKTNDLSKHPNKIGFTYADGRVSTAAGSYQITGQTWNDINKTLNLPDFSENSQKIAATYLAETRYKQQTNGDLWEDLLSAKNDPKKLTEIKNKLGSTWTPLAGKDDEFLKNYLGYNGIDNLFKKQNSALIDDNNKNIINTANIDRVTTLRNIYLESEKEARSTKEVAPRFSKNDALINAEDYVGKIDHKKAKEIFYSKIDPTQYTEEEIFDAMNPGVRSGILEKGRIVDQKNKEEESEKGILNKIGERVAAIFLDDPEVIDGKYNIADRTISETMNPAESIKNDLSFTRDQLLAKDQNGKYTLDNSIDSLNISQDEKLKLKDKSKRIRERLLTKENAEYNVKTSALEVGMDVVNHHLKTVKENMKQELGDEKMAIIESVSKNPNATQEDIQAFQEIVSSSKYKDEYIKLLDKSSEFGNKFNSLPPVYKESLFLKKQSEKLQTEYDQYLADRGTKFQIFNSLSRFSNDLVPSIASSIVESGAAIVGTAIEATTGADLNATKYLIDQSANTRSIRSSKENLGGLYQAAEFTDQLGNKYKTTFDEDGNVQDIYYENGVKHYTEDRFTDTLYTLAESLNKKKELYQNRDNYNFSGLGMLDQGLESAKDIVGMMIPFGGALGITAKGAKLAKNASALSKGLNALKKVATSERAREFGSSMMMFADNFAEEAINEGIVDPAGISSYTAAKTTLECLTEMVFPFATKMSDDLGRVLNRTPSGTNTNAGNIVSNYLQKRFGNNWVKVLADGVPPGLLTDFTKTLKNIGADAISEGAEELMVEAANPFVNAALNNSGLSSVHLDEDWGNATEWGNSFLVGAFMGGVLGTGRTGLKGISQGKDLFNKEARYYNYVKEGLKSTLANKEVTDHFINSLEGKKPKEEIDRLRKIIDNTRKDASYILENENPNSSLADNLLTTAFELNMQREGRSFGKLPQTIKEEEKTTFLERKLSELNKNVALGSRTEINIADILSHPSTTITGEKDGKVSKVDIKRAYRDLSEADINKLIEETHDKVFSESNVKKQSNLFLQKEYAKELLSGFNKLVKQENKLNEEDNSFSVEEIENPIDRKEDAEDVKAKKVENTKLNTDELKQEKIRLNQELSGYTTSEEYNAAYNSESDPVLKSFIREHQEVRANTQKKGIELEDGSNKLTKAEQLNNDNLPRRYGASKLFEAKETREVGNNLKKVIESNPNYKSELDKLKKNASYQTNVPELKGLFNYINGIYMLESDQDPSITPDTFDTDKAINEYYSSISNFNNDTNLQSAIDNYNKNTEVQEEKPVEVISDLEKQQIVTYTNLQKKIKQGGPWRYDTIIANIEKAYNDNVLTKDQHDVLVNLANEKNNRLKGKGNKSEVSKQEPVKSKSEVNNIEAKKADIERRRQEDLKNLNKTTLYNGSDRQFVELTPSSPVQMEDIEGKNKIFISKKQSDGTVKVGIARRMENGLWTWVMSVVSDTGKAMGSKGFTDDELMDNLAANKMRKAEVVAERDYDAELKELEQSNSQIDTDTPTEETRVETLVSFDTPVVQTMNFFRSTVGKPGGESSIIVKYTREDGSFGITTIPIDTWKKMRSSNLDKFEIKDENGNILTGKVTYQEWINENVVRNPDTKKNIEDELRKTNVAQTILKEDDTVYYEVNFENYNGTDSALPKRKFEIVVVAYYKDGKIVKADTVGATRAIVGTLINNPDTPEGDSLSEKDPVRNLLYPYYLNKEVKQIPVKVAGKNNRISYHKGEWRSLEPTEIEKYEFDVVIQPFQGSNIGLAQDAKENSDEFKKSDTVSPLGKNSVGKVIAKIPSGVPGEFIGVELNTPMLKDFPKGQDKIKRILEDILELANSGKLAEAEKLMRNDWVKHILNTLAYRTPFSTFDAMRQYKGETQQNPRGGKGPIILFPIKSAGKTYHTFVVKTKTGEPLDLSIDEILDFLGDTRVHVPNNQDALKKFINENPTALKTDLALPIETDNTTFPVVFNNSTVTLQPIEPNTEKSNIKEDTTPVRRSFKEGEKARFKISENTEEYTSTSAENYIRKRFEEVGVAVSDASLNILRKVYEVGDRKIWGAFHKAIVYLSSEAGELTGKHEGWHVLFGLFTTPEHKIRLYKEAFKKYGNELGISKEEFENALSQFTTNKDALFSTENDFYSTLDILDRIEEAMARDAETFKVTGVLSEEFKDKYPTIYKLFNDILTFIYDSYLRLQPYIPYLANRSNLNSLYYQMDKNYFGRGFNGKRLSRYKNIFRINYNNLYSQNEPRFSVEGLSTKEAKEYAEFVIDKLLRNIIQDKFDGYRSLTRSLKDAEDATKMLNESWQYIDEYARYYVEDNEIKNVDKELQTLSRIKNDPDFKLLALSRLNHITGYAADLEGIVEDSNTENKNEDNTVEESSEKIIIRNSNVDVTKKISGKLREMLTLLHKKDKNGDFILSGPFSIYSTYDYTEVYKRLYQYLTDIPDNKLMWKTLIKHSSTYPYFREIAEYIFDQLVSRNNIPGYEGQSLNDYISDENLSSILEDNIYKSELFSLIFKRFGDQTSHQYIQTIVKSDGSANLMYVNKENIDDNIRDEMDSHFSANPQLFPEVITQNDLSDLYGKFGLLVTDNELANLTKKEIELLIEDFTKLGAKVKELISKGEIPAKSVLKNSGITYIMKSYNKLKPNLTNNVTRTIKNDLQFNIGYSNYISRLMSKTKSNAAYYKNRMKKDIFAKYLPAWRDMLVNTKNLDGIGWEILTDTGSKLTPGEMGKEYHELTKRELKILNINNFNAIGYQTSKDVVVANPIYSDATVHTYMKVPRIDRYSIIEKLALTALAELSRIEYHSKNKSDSKHWNENGGNFLLLGFLNGEIEIEVTENDNKQKQKVNGKEYFLNKYRSLLEDGTLPEARIQDMVSSLSLPIKIMMENEFQKYLQSLSELGIITSEFKLIKGVLSSQVGKENDPASVSLLDNFYNQVYYNTQFIGVIGGDPAYYKPNSSPRKSGDTLENYIQIDIDHLKRMKAWHSPNSRGVYIDEFGKEKTTKKVLYLKDINLPSSPEYAELMKHHGIKDSDKHSLTDAQGYNNPLFHLMVLQANAKITPEERAELQKRFININQKEDGSLSKTWKKGIFKKKDDKKNGIKSIMDIIKPFYAGHVEMILDENGNTSNVPFTEKSSEKGILIDEAYRLKDKEGNPTTISVPEGNPSKEYFNKYLNPTLAKMLWVMQQGEIDSIAFDTTLKIYNPTAKTMSIDEFMDSSVDDILKNTLELPLEGYGDQQEIPVEKHKAKNTHEGSQTAAIFMGRGNAEQKEALNEIIKHAVDDKIKKWKLKRLLP
jgi:muramidase (phage lysozyme)